MRKKNTFYRTKLKLEKYTDDVFAKKVKLLVCFEKDGQFWSPKMPF